MLQLHFYFFLCANNIFCTFGCMKLLCVVLQLLAPCPLGRCFQYLCVHECSLCSSTISTSSSVGRMFFLYFWVHGCSLCSCSISTPILCGKDVFCTSGFMDVVFAPAAFLPLLLWEGCFLYLWVHECSLCSSSISTSSSVQIIFSAPLGA